MTAHALWPLDDAVYLKIAVPLYTCTHCTMELQVIKKFTPKLITAIKDNIDAVLDKCLACELIAEDTYHSVLDNTTNIADKARSLLRVVANGIETNPACYYTLMEILNDVLPKRSSKRIFDDMKEDLQKRERKERAKMARCTDDARLKSGQENNSTRRRLKNLSASHGSRGTANVDPGYNETDSSRDQSPIPLLRQKLKEALGLVERADLDAQNAQHDEESWKRKNQDLAKQNEMLQKQLSKANDEKKKLISALEKEQRNLDELIQEKKKEILTLQHALQKTENNHKKLKEELELARNKYDTKIKEKEGRISYLEETLRSRESLIKQKETTVIELNMKIVANKKYESCKWMLILILLFLVLVLVLGLAYKILQ